MASKRAPSGRAERVSRGLPRGLSALAGLLLAASGCAAIEASRRSLGTITGDSFSPTRAPAASYGPSTLTCPAGGLNAQMAEVLAEVAKTGKPEMKADGRLCAVAETFLGWSAAGGPPESLTRQVAWHFGLPSATPRVSMVTFDSDDLREIAARLVESIDEFARQAVSPRFGLADESLPASSRTKQGNRTRVVLVALDEALDLDPVPRALPLNGVARVSGRLLPGDANATVLTCDPSGKLETAAQPGGSFGVEVRCGERRGEIETEIRAERDGATVVLARFPIACGVPLPSSFRVLPPPPAGPADAAAVEQRMFRLLNEERATAGAPPLIWDGALGKVARLASEGLHAQAERATAKFDLAAELRRADALSPLVLQNPVVARSAEEAHALLLTSPLNRSNLFNAQATHAGIGVVAVVDPNGGNLLYATQLLVRQQPIIDAEALRGKLREAIAQRRAGASAAPFASDATLDGVAQKYASELVAAGGTLGKEREGDILAPIYKGYRSVDLISGAKPEPLDFADEPRLLGAATLLGVGVAQGSSPVLGKNAIFVVIVSATKAPKK